MGFPIPSDVALHLLSLLIGRNVPVRCPGLMAILMRAVLLGMNDLHALPHALNIMEKESLLSQCRELA